MKSRRHSWLQGTLLAGCCAVLLHEWLLPCARSQWVAFLPPAAIFRLENLPDPVPLRRVLIPAERVPGELQRSRAGVAVKLLRTDFEARVQRAARAIERRQHPPRLLETRYQARLLAGGALAGVGQWKIVNPSPGPGLLSVSGLNLALTRAQLDGSAAILGDLEDKGLDLLVEGQGEHQAVLDWTTRGEPVPNGLRFRLDIPPCPLASVELELPEDRLIELTSENCLVSSPRPTRDGGRLWRLDCPSRNQIDFVVRRSPGPGEPAPLVLARLRIQQSVNLDQVEADFDFHLEIVRGGIRDLSFDCDPSLRPAWVMVRNTESESWEWQPGAGPAKPARLQLHLPVPVQTGILPVRIHCLAAGADVATWRCPGLQLSGAILQDETLTLRIAPEIQIEDWQPGDFELVRLEEEPGGSQVLTLTTASWQLEATGASREPESAGRAKTTAARRPRAQLRVQEAESQVHQVLWWQVKRDSQILTVALAYECIRGSLFRLPLRLPPGWKVEHVEAAPAGAIRQWVVVPAEQGWSRLILEPLHALQPTQSASVTLTLRAGLAPGEDKAKLPFPQVFPEQAAVWETTLGLQIDPAFDAKIELRSPVSEQSSPGGQTTSAISGGQRALLPPASSPLPGGPWGDRAPDYMYRSRRQPIQGNLVLRSKQPRCRGQWTEEIVWTPGQASVQARLLLQPDVDGRDAVDLYASAPLAGTWSWKCLSSTNAIREVRRLEAMEIAPQLLPLGSGSTLTCPSLLHLPRPQGTWWRLTFAQPLRDPLSIEINGRLAVPEPVGVAAVQLVPLAARQALAAIGLQAGTRSGEKLGFVDGLCEVPLFALAGAGRTESEVRLQPAQPGRVNVHTRGLQEVRMKNTQTSPEPWRVFHYHQPPFRLALESRESAKQPATFARVNHAELDVSVQPDGRLLHHYQFDVQGWKRSRLPVLLPANSHLQSVRIDGRWLLNVSGGRLTADGLALDLPIPAGESRHAFELSYSAEAGSGVFWTQFNAPAPILPVQPLEFQRRWQLSPGLAPVDEAGYSRLPDSDAQPGERWAANPQVPVADRIRVVRRDRLWGLAWSLTVLLLLLAWHLRRSSRPVLYFFLILWLASSTLGLLWLPATLRDLVWPPLVSGLVAAGCWYLIAAAHSRVSVPRPISVAGVLFGCCVVGAASVGAGPVPETIWLLPPSADGRQVVLVRPQLLEQLDEMIQRGGVERLGVVLLSAGYEGQATGERAEFRAEFQAHCFRDGPVKLVLPLTGIELRKATVDRTDAFLEALQEPEKGYRLSIKGRGLHTVRLQFWVSLAASAEQELRFTIPQLAQSHLTWTVSHPVQYLFAVSARGAQVLRKEGNASRLDVDLGRLPVCLVRWREQGKQPVAVRPEVKELYFWELRPALSRLLGVLQYRLKEGATDSLSIALPPHLEVRHVEVDAWLGSSPTPRLRDWSLVEQPAGRRRLELHFQVPVSGAVQVYLDLVPLEQPQAFLGLPLPLPEGAAAAPGDSLLAYRVEGAPSQLVDFAGVSAIGSEMFMAEWQNAETEDPGFPERAFRFRRTASAAPMLRLSIRPAHGPAQCFSHLTWRVGSDLAEFEARVKVAASESRLALLEWQMPEGLRLTSVRGTQVRSWSRAGSRLQIWLRKSAPEANLELAGWEARAASQTAGTFRLPVLTPVGALAPESSVRVIVPKDFVLKPIRLQKLAPSPGDRSADNERTFVSREVDYQGEFLIQPTTHVVIKPQMPAPKVQGVDTQPNRGLLPGPDLTRKVAVLWFEEQQVVPGYSRQYLHRSLYWVAAESATELGLTLPPGAHLESLTIDGKELAPLQKDSDRIQLPLPGERQVHLIRLEWTLPDNAESLERPLLAAPLLSNTRAAAADDRIWNIAVPPGYRMVSVPVFEPMTAAEVERTRSEALRRSGLPAAAGEQETRVAEESSFWKAPTAIAAAPVELIALYDEQEHRALAGTGLLAVLVLIASLLPLFPRLVRGILALWPEQVAALGCAGWLWLGGNRIGLMVIVLGLAARLGYGAAWFIARGRRPAPASVPAGISPPCRG